MRLSKFFNRKSMAESASEDSSNDEASVFDSPLHNSTIESCDDLSLLSPNPNKQATSGSRSNSVKSHKESSKFLCPNPGPARRPVSCYVTPPLPIIEDFEYFPADNVTKDAQKRDPSTNLLRKVSLRFGRSSLVHIPHSNASTSKNSRGSSVNKAASLKESQNPSTTPRFTIDEATQPESKPSTPTFNLYESSTPSPTFLRYSRISLDSDSESMVSAATHFHTPSSKLDTSSDTSSTSYGPLVLPEKTPVENHKENISPPKSEFPSPDVNGTPIISDQPSRGLAIFASATNLRLPKIITLNKANNALTSSLPQVSLPQLEAPYLSCNEIQNIDKVLMKKNDKSKTRTMSGNTSSLPLINKSDNVLKLKIYIGKRNDDAIAFKLRKDKLKNISELLDVVTFKVLDRVNDHSYLLNTKCTNRPPITSDEVNISIFFKDKSLSPITLKDYGRRKTSCFSYSQKDLLLDYIMVKDKVYIRVNY